MLLRKYATWLLNAEDWRRGWNKDSTLRISIVAVSQGTCYRCLSCSSIKMSSIHINCSTVSSRKRIILVYGQVISYLWPDLVALIELLYRWIILATYLFCDVLGTSSRLELRICTWYIIVIYICNIFFAVWNSLVTHCNFASTSSRLSMYEWIVTEFFVLFVFPYMVQEWLSFFLELWAFFLPKFRAWSWVHHLVIGSTLNISRFICTNGLLEATDVKLTYHLTTAAFIQHINYYLKAVCSWL